VTVACIVQARLGSTRLPAKVLLPLPNGRMVLQEVLYRCQQIPGIDVIVAAIPDTDDNDIIRDLIIRDAPFAQIVRGPEHDVLARYAKAAREVNADVIMRITSDCPLIDPITCHAVLVAFHRHNAECAVNDDPMTIPKGLNCEVFSREILEHVDAALPRYVRGQVGYGAALIDALNDREHVTPAIRRRAKANGRFISVTKEGEDMSSKRWTLDTLEDFIVIWRILEARGA
jgi:spore coat polysaccharide biosynthesis protein SpsF